MTTVSVPVPGSPSSPDGSVDMQRIYITPTKTPSFRVPQGDNGCLCIASMSL